MTRHAPMPPSVVGAVVLFLAIFLGVVLWLTLPRTRPADVEPTPTAPVIVVVDPTPRAVESPRAPTRTATVAPTERLPMVTSTPLPPTATPEPTEIPTPVPPTPTAVVQRG